MLGCLVACSTTCQPPILLKSTSARPESRKPLGNIGAFHWNLNPLSGCSIFEICTYPFLLVRNLVPRFKTTIKVLECFQCEIGHAEFLICQSTTPKQWWDLDCSGLQCLPVFWFASSLFWHNCSPVQTTKSAVGSSPPWQSSVYTMWKSMKKFKVWFWSTAVVCYHPFLSEICSYSC